MVPPTTVLSCLPASSTSGITNDQDVQYSERPHLNLSTALLHSLADRQRNTSSIHQMSLQDMISMNIEEVDVPRHYTMSMASRTQLQSLRNPTGLQKRSLTQILSEAIDVTNTEDYRVLNDELKKKPLQEK